MVQEHFSLSTKKVSHNCHAYNGLQYTVSSASEQTARGRDPHPSDDCRLLIEVARFTRRRWRVLNARVAGPAAPPRCHQRCCRHRPRPRRPATPLSREAPPNPPYCSAHAGGPRIFAWLRAGCARERDRRASCVTAARTGGIVLWHRVGLLAFREGCGGDRTQVVHARLRRAGGDVSTRRGLHWFGGRACSCRS